MLPTTTGRNFYGFCNCMEVNGWNSTPPLLARIFCTEFLLWLFDVYCLKMLPLNPFFLKSGSGLQPDKQALFAVHKKKEFSCYEN